jgi:hypothetical protein
MQKDQFKVILVIIKVVKISNLQRKFFQKQQQKKPSLKMSHPNSIKENQ